MIEPKNVAEKWLWGNWPCWSGLGMATGPGERVSLRGWRAGPEVVVGEKRWK